MYETIQIKESRKGTTIKSFTSASDPSLSGNPISFIVTDLVGTPIKLAETLFDAKFNRNGDNNFEYNKSATIVSGITSVQEVEFVFTEEKKLTIRQEFIKKQKKFFGQNTTAWVFFEERLIDDYFANISVIKTFDVLNTLSVHNSVVGEIPKRESPTGVLFGKLEATQKINDENGNRVRIPLVNVVISVFNKSDEFPSVQSVDDDGNRITLNLIENSFENQYFNKESFETDKQFLRNNSVVNFVPPKYKYTSITNEKGEFIIQDIPIGEQVFIFEIDLLKQGLTKDEVALNFFPYPVDENPNIDSVPHYFFKQIPVNIVPSWGDFQSGYTQLDITVPLDLRKWTTHYVSPIAFYGLSLQERVNKGYFSPLTFKVRDMTKQGFPATKSVEIVEIDDLLLKNPDQTLEWENEIKTIKNRAEFRKNDFQAFKLPANLYDPDGIGTNGKKGVWLSSYQFKMFYQDQNIYRSTGFERKFLSTGIISKNNFDLNRNADDSNLLSPSGITGTFPYEKPWSINYPEKYSIPKLPLKLNPDKKYDINSNPINATEPKWLDGDRVGGQLSNVGASGYGLQNINGKAKENLFSKRVTSDVVFKYEKGVAWHEEYSNGFQPVLNSTSNVENGEKFQRLEAGYGYWLRPEGWPRVENFSWGDFLIQSDIDSSFTPPAGLNPASLSKAVIKLPEEIIALKLDDSTLPYLKKGSLDIYRLYNPKLLIEPGPPFIEKFARIDFQSIYKSNSRTTIRKTELVVDNNNDRVSYVNGEGVMQIINRGSISVIINGIKIAPEESHNFAGAVATGMELILPSNTSYNSTDNSYDRSAYTIKMYDVQIEDITKEITMEVDLPADKDTITYYATSKLSGVQVKARFKSDGSVKCGTDFFNEQNVLINGIAFLAGAGSNLDSVSFGNQISPDCTENIPIDLL